MTPTQQAPTVINPHAGPKIVTTYRFTMKPSPELNVATANGTVTIKGGSGNEIVVTVTRRGGSDAQMKAIDVRAVRNGNTISVASKMPADCSSCAASYEIAVPLDTAIRASSDDGAIHVNDVAGTVEAASKLGNVLGGGLSGNVKFGADNGFVNAGFTSVAHVSSIILASGNGAVRLVLPHAALVSHIKAGTANGQITTNGVSLNVVKSAKGAAVDQTLAKTGPNIKLGSANGAISIIQMP